MIAAVTYGSGNNYVVGKTIGCHVSELVRENINNFLRVVHQKNHSLTWLRGKAQEEIGLLTTECIDEIAGVT